MKHLAALILTLTTSLLSQADATKWEQGKTATFRIDGRNYDGEKKLEVTRVVDNTASVSETIFLDNQVKICEYTINTKNDKTINVTCAGQIPKYLHTDFYPAQSAFYIGQKKTPLKLKVGTYISTCKTYRVGNLTGQAFAVNCTSNDIPFWGEVATAVSDASGNTDIMYTELIEIK